MLVVVALRLAMVEQAGQAGLVVVVMGLQILLRAVLELQIEAVAVAVVVGVQEVRVALAVQA
jgi:hypothetical protein